MEGLHGDKESAQALAMGMQKRAYLQRALHVEGMRPLGVSHGEQWP